MGKRDSRYNPLFEPVKIGPVTAPNRFYQVPHCSGMGYQRPQMMAAMRGIKAERIPVTLVTPEGRVAGWSAYTQEQAPLIKMLLDTGVEIFTDSGLHGWNGSETRLECVFTGRETSLAARYLVPISARLPDDTLWRALNASKEQFLASGGISLNRVGDCKAPGLIAAAVYDGHKLARELGQQQQTTGELARDRVVVGLK
jgi:hypothetical protein